MSNIFSAIKSTIEAIQAKLHKYLGIRSEKGLSVVEYTFLSALIAIVVILSAQALGEKTLEVYTNILNALP